MLLESIASPLARAYYAWVKRCERQVGSKLLLCAPAAGWIDATMIFDMAPVWRKFNLNAKGVNYSTIGAVKNGLSSRYEANSPYYQSWLGGYIVQFPNPREWTLNDHFELGVADQKNWLKLYEGNIWSNTDVGNAKPFALPYMMADMANLFRFDNPKVKAAGSAFIPTWSENEPLDSFQKILLKGYMGFIPLNANTTVMLYANACEFTDKHGKKVDTFAKIAMELQKLMQKVEIQIL